MQTITITISSPNTSNIILKEVNSEATELTAKLVKLLKIIHPKEVQK